MKQYKKTKEKVISLRKQGLTYGEIKESLKIKIPKSTLSSWCSSVVLSSGQKKTIKKKMKKNLSMARQKALYVLKEKRKKYFENIVKNNQHLSEYFKNRDVSKIILSILYLAEGGKSEKGSIMFGNSDPLIIKLFLKLLRNSYKIDEDKFRCTLQCRSDQDINKLEKYWSSTSGIKLRQFYKARVDKRSIGKTTKKINYKGVCRINYFDANIFHEIMTINKILTKE